jgi:hypothetical protein
MLVPWCESFEARTTGAVHDATVWPMTPTEAWVSHSENGAMLLWTARNGVRCVVTRYDETRYQLRLAREGGTIKADLFSSHAAAVSASQVWRQHIEEFRG